MERGVALLCDATSAVFLCGINRNSPLGGLPFESYSQFLEEFRDETLQGVSIAGPMLKSLVEQAALLHHTIAKLYSDGSQATDLETKRTCLQVAANLTGEFRRLVKEILGQCETAARRCDASNTDDSEGGRRRRAK